MKYIIPTVLILLTAGCSTIPKAPEPVVTPTVTPAPSATPRPISKPLIGFTLDDPYPTESIVQSLDLMTHDSIGPRPCAGDFCLSSLVITRSKASIRIVFDAGERASEYAPLLKLYKPKTDFLMGELLDSFYIGPNDETNGCDLKCYTDRTKDYLTLKPYLDALEVGNEVNGSWTGSGVAEKVIASLKLTKAAGVPAALTLYMDQKETWRTWAQALPADIRAQFDYVFMSHYSQDNDGYEPAWIQVVDMMGNLFPNAKLGIGEMGPGEDYFKSTPVSARMEIATHYWGLMIMHPRWIGFGGYWYGSQELKSNPTDLINAVNLENGK